MDVFRNGIRLAFENYEESELAEKKNRSLILGNLFHPALDGMFTEENIPYLTLEALNRLGSLV